MRRAIGTAAIAVLAFTGCSAEEAEKPAAQPSKPPVVSSVPSPDAGQTQALSAALSAIKPELVADEERAVRRARNVCSDIKADKDAATMATNANARFSGGTAGQLTDAQGAKIVEAVKVSFCA